MESSSDEESDEPLELMIVVSSRIHDHNKRQKAVHMGLIRPRMANAACNWEASHYWLQRDYFHPTKPFFMPNMYRRHFLMSRDLFLTVLREVRYYDPFFGCKPDAIGKLGFTSYQECFAAICILAYRVSSDLIDEYLWMRETTCLDVTYKFCRAAVPSFGELYLREPTIADTARMLSINKARGFPRMIDFIDCMHRVLWIF
jgi:hypothetical protein